MTERKKKLIVLGSGICTGLIGFGIFLTFLILYNPGNHDLSKLPIIGYIGISLMPVGMLVVVAMVVAFDYLKQRSGDETGKKH